MDKTLLLCFALLAVPLALAHTPEGTPRNFCEFPSMWSSHEYDASPAPVPLLPFLPPPPGGGSGGSADKYRHPYVDGNANGACPNPGDFDGHKEFGYGGYVLVAVRSGDGATDGTLFCWGELGHHPHFGPFSAVDASFASVSFTVNVDTVNLVDPSNPGCGDFQFDHSEVCANWCQPTFPSGLDGAYHIRLGDPAAGSTATRGHVFA